MNKENEELIIADWINKRDELRKQEILQKLTKHNFDISLDFNSWQMEQISLGLKDNIDISLFAKKEYNSYQMEQIRLGLKKNLDVSIYAKKEYSSKKMRGIRLSLPKKSTLK